MDTLSCQAMGAIAKDAARLKALGHPVRLGIAVQLAAEPETCACDFADVFGVSQPTVSEHLRVLREAGLVTTKRRGTQICYSLDPAAVREIEEVLAGLRRTRRMDARGATAS
jgi:ArsR family transcriptional regulator, arsenate/arsenite/antimonite-responsive transcriptional repressor